MTTLTVRRLEQPEAALLDQVERQFVSLYQFMNAHGWLLPLAPGGEKRWRRSVERALGRFSALAIALDGDIVAGFAHGAMALVPDYLGGGAVGQINHVFVEERYRDQDVTAPMIGVLTEWFREKNAASVEGRVIYGDKHALDVWEQHGYTRELHQLRWFLEDPPQ